MTVYACLVAGVIVFSVIASVAKQSHTLKDLCVRVIGIRLPRRLRLLAMTDNERCAHPELVAGSVLVREDPSTGSG